jgi:hypothetical protein
MKETLISGKILLSLTCCTVHTSRRLGYIVPAIGGLNPGNSGLEDNVPRRMDRYISSLLLAAIAAPTAIIADPRPQDAGSSSESTIGTTVIIITGPITRTAPTGATWKHSTELSLVHLGHARVSHEDPPEVQYCNSQGTWFRHSTYFYPLLVSPALSVLLYAVAPGTGGGQDSPTKERGRHGPGANA